MATRLTNVGTNPSFLLLRRHRQHCQVFSFKNKANQGMRHRP
uniref:Uncharacterized protein n=1 Tax=Arundo donax TaxID=35708 RepID=A0A0A9DEL2_ARUDO